MGNFFLSRGPKTPAVKFNADEGHLELKGPSIPDNSEEFYRPLIQWVESYGTQPKPQTTVDVEIEYFDVSSSKFILDLFRKLEAINGKGTEVSINWYYEYGNDDIREAGEVYQAIISVPFKIIQAEED